MYVYGYIVTSLGQHDVVGEVLAQSQCADGSSLERLVLGEGSVGEGQRRIGCLGSATQTQCCIECGVAVDDGEEGEDVLHTLQLFFGGSSTDDQGVVVLLQLIEGGNCCNDSGINH